MDAVMALREDLQQQLRQHENARQASEMSFSSRMTRLEDLASSNSTQGVQ